ncbi:AEC family transporter [Acidocella sp.]|uniref:AEC family transporter n=1 Tax=Acidocella sp. TaxID=50710 RepID=UPI003D028084
MYHVVASVFPVFALILLGYLAARRGILGPEATDSLNKFVVWLALPALLFQAMAQIMWDQIDHLGYIGAFTIGAVATFGLSFLFGGRNRPDGHRLADRAIEGLNASYSNTGYMGIPLCLAAIGPGSLVPSIIATIVIACVLFAGAIILIEFDLQEMPDWHATIFKVLVSLLRNPLIFSPLLGMVAAFLRGETGFSLPAPVFHMTSLLGAAASPCALVTIGLFLAQSSASKEEGVILRLVGLKLIVQPAITLVLAYWVWPMPPVWAETAVIMAALPIGTGPFMLAKLYDREAAITSRAILVSTILSLITVSSLIAWLE